MCVAGYMDGMAGWGWDGDRGWRMNTLLCVDGWVGGWVNGRMCVWMDWLVGG